MIIDIHGHIGNINFSPYWNKSFEQVEEICEKAGVDYCVVSAARSIMYDVREGNKEVLEAVKKSKRLLGYTVVNPLYPDSLEDLRYIKDEKKIVGVKMHPDYHGYDLGSKIAREFMDKVVKKTSLILFHTSCMSGTAFSSADKICRIARDYPETTFISAHLAGIYQNPLYPYFPNMEGVEKVLEYNLNNLYIDTAHYLMYVYEGAMEKVVDYLGADKIVFGTDVPLQGELQIRFAIEVIKKLKIRGEDKRKILSGTAKKILGIS